LPARGVAGGSHAPLGAAIGFFDAAYKTSNPPEDWMGTKADIKRFLRTRNEDQVDPDFLRLFTPGVDPAGWDMTRGEWLMKIHALL
jgi:hypothetical protein